MNGMEKSTSAAFYLNLFNLNLHVCKIFYDIVGEGKKSK